MVNKQLKFREDGSFTIVQFTDLHWRNGERKDQQTYSLMKAIVEQEKPDLIIFTGDMIHSEKTSNSKRAFLESINVAEESMIPWAAVFGNHDAENGTTRDELMMLQNKCAYSLSEAGPAEIKGVGNYAIEVEGYHSNKVAAVCYCFDSGSHSTSLIEGYEWIDHSQIDWYTKLSSAYTQDNKGIPLNSLAFFHIPIPEYQELWDMYTCYGHNYEGVGASRINSGLFAAFQRMSDVRGVFVGHDHVNDYWGDLYGIRLCYGKATGFNGYGRAGFARGARIIRLQENAAGFQTWLRLEEGVKQDQQPEHAPMSIRTRAHES